MTETTQVVAVHGNTFEVKDDLKKLGFRFRRTAGSHDYAEKYLDRGFNMDVPIWYVETNDVEAILAKIADFPGLEVAVDGKHMDSSCSASASAPVSNWTSRRDSRSFSPDTDDDLFDSAFTPRFA